MSAAKVRPTILMPVYNGIEYDGRVRRAAEALSQDNDVIVVSLATGNVFSPSGYRVEAVSVPSAARIKLRPHVAFWVAVLVRAMRLRPDAVHAHDFFLAAPGWLAARLTGARFIYDAHELIIPSPGVKMSARDKFWYWLESWAVRRANVVISANIERATLMKSHYVLHTTPTVVRNIPPDLARSIARQTLTVEEGGSSAALVRLVYQGDVSLERGVGRFVEAVAQLGPQYELTIVGPGPDSAAVAAMIVKLGVGDRVRVVGRVPAAELPAIMRAADLGVICYPDRGWNNIYCAPNKLYEYAQVGLPMVATANPVLRSVFDTYRIGYSGDDVVETIRAAARDRATLAGNLHRFLAENRWENESSTLRDVYRRLLAVPDSEDYGA